MDSLFDLLELPAHFPFRGLDVISLGLCVFGGLDQDPFCRLNAFSVIN